jgi:poly(A) polymerase
VKPEPAIDIVRQLRARGHEAYLVGGCVRDMVMGLEPSDYDIATSARPEEVMTIFPRTEAVGVQFGVVLVIHQGHPYEVATFRSDEAYVDGRRPTGVVFTDVRQDVVRRDFTINGLLYDPIERRVIDYVRGQEDINAKIVRAIGDPRQRFDEDKLRILRAIRFGARLGYTIEPATWQAVGEMAPQIHQVSAERIREELVRILTEGQAARGVRMLEESGLRAEILPELAWTVSLERSLEMIKPQAPPDLAMGVLLHGVPAARAGQIVERLKFSRAEMHHISALLENLPAFDGIRQMSVSALKRFFRLTRFEDHLELVRIHALTSGGDLDNYSFASRKYSEWTEEDIAPRLLISGEDLIALGFKPGRIFKEMLNRVEDEQLEGRLREKSAAIEFVLKHYGDRKE